MILFVKVGQNKPLPVDVKSVFGEVCVKYQPRALGLRLNEKLNLRIVTERLEVSDSDDPSRHLFFVKYFSRTKSAVNGKSILDKPLYKLGLYLTHKPRLYL